MKCVEIGSTGMWNYCLNLKKKYASSWINILKACCKISDLLNTLCTRHRLWIAGAWYAE